MLMIVLLFAWACTGMAEGSETGTGEAPEYPVLQLDTPADVIIRDEGEVKWFAFTPEIPGVYRFEASGDYDNKAAVYTDPEGTPIAENDDRESTSGSSESEKANFQLDASLEAGTTYYFAAQMCYDDTVGDFEVTLSYQRKGVESVVVLQEPRLTYYVGYDSFSNIIYSGACVQVNYTDGSTSLYNNIYDNYYLRVTHNAPGSWSSLQEGAFTLTLSLTTEDWSQAFEAQVVSASEMRELFVGEPLTTGYSLGERFRFTAPADGLYMISNELAASSIYRNMYVYDADGNQVDALVGSTGSSGKIGQMLMLNAGETYMVSVSLNSASNYVDNRMVLTVESPDVALMSEEYTPGTGALFAEYIPAEGGVYSLNLGLESSVSVSYNDFIILSETGVNCYSGTSSYGSYDEEGNYCHIVNNILLEAGTKYYIAWTNPTGVQWKVRIENKGGEMLTVPAHVTGSLLEEQKVLSFRAENTGYYHVRLFDTPWPGYTGSYSGAWSNDTYQVDAEGNSHSCIDYVFHMSAGYQLILTFSQQSESAQYKSYDMTVEYLPEIESVTFAQAPDKTEFEAAELMETGIFDDVELLVTYEDGVTETVSIDGSSLTGIRWSRDSLDVAAILAGGENSLYYRYLGQYVGFSFTVNPAQPPAVIPVLEEGNELSGTFEVAEGTEAEYLWYTFVPSETGRYNLTGSYSGGYALYATLYNSQGDVVNVSYSNGVSASIQRGWTLEAGSVYRLNVATVASAGSENAWSLRMYSAAFRNTIALDEVQHVDIDTVGMEYWFSFTPTATAQYTFYSFNNHGDPEGLIYLGDAQLARNDDWNDVNFRIDYVLNAGQTYYLVARDLGNNNTIEFDVLVELTDEEIGAEEGGELTVGVPQYVELSEGMGKWFDFTPEESGVYRFYSYNYSYNPTAALYLGDEFVAGDSAYQYGDFLVVASLEEGNTYRLFTRCQYADSSDEFYVAVARKVIDERELVLDVDEYVSIAPEQEVWFTFIPEESGTYRFASHTYSDDPYATLYQGDELLADDFSSYSSRNFSIVYDLEAGVEYRLVTKSRSTGNSDSFYVRAEKLTALTLDVDEFADVPAGQEVWFTFTPEETGNYTFYSHDATYDPYGILFSDSQFIVSSDDDGDGNNFLITRTLEAGRQYRLAARRYSYPSSGGTQYYVRVTRLPQAESFSILNEPYRTVYAYPFSELNYSGLRIQAELSDGTVEELSYGYQSTYSRQSMQVQIQDPVYESGYSRLMPGSYDVVVTYCGLTQTFTITVNDVEDMETELTLDGAEITGTWSGGDKYFAFTPPQSGFVLLHVEQTGSYPSVSLYDDGMSSVYTLASSSGSYSDGGSNVYWYDLVYQLDAGAHYVARMSTNNNQTELDTYLIRATSLATMTPGSELVGNDALHGYDYVCIDIDQTGFYKYDYRMVGETYGSVNYSYSDPSLFNASGSSMRSFGSGNSGNDSSVYFRETTRFYYLEPGRYVMRVGGSNRAAYPNVGTHVLNELDQTSWPLEVSGETGVSCADGVAFTVPEGAEGTYTIDVSADYYGYAYLYDSDMNWLNDVYMGSQWDEASGAYVYRGELGVTLEAGRTYALYFNLSSSSGHAWSASVGTKLLPVNLELVKAPKQRYYYKLDNLTRDTGLKDGSSIRITYNDGSDPELLYAYNNSSRTGYGYDIALPEGAEFNDAGNLLPGTYYAQLTFGDLALTVPIKVATIAEMPRLVLNENGQGVYTGPVEDTGTGYGYVRFLAQQDGFYNMTLSVDAGDYIYYDTIYNSAYSSISLSHSTTETTDNRYLANGRVYVRKGQTCYIRYRKDHYNAGTDNDFTLTVELATDEVVTPMTLNTAYTIGEQSGEQWYSFTPESDGYYYLDTIGRNYYTYSYYGDEITMYRSPDASSSESYYSYYSQNGYDRCLQYSLTKDRTYYFRVRNDSSSAYSLVIVKQANPVSLEWLGEGDVYCSTISDNVARSFADLKFRITYEDGTTEDMTFGYNSSSERAYSLMHRTIGYTEPNWRKNEDGTIVTDQVCDVIFYMTSSAQTVRTTIQVTPRSIESLDDMEGTQTVTIPAGDAIYFRFTPEEDGYYRFEASDSNAYPSVALYDQYMASKGFDYGNSYYNGSYCEVRVFELAAGETYMLRVQNNAGSAQPVTIVTEKLSPVASLEIVGDSLPQTNYYLGIDRQYSDEGLQVTVIYEDGASEVVTISGGIGQSAATGLQMTTSLEDGAGSHSLGSVTGTRTVTVSYMGAIASYNITVQDSDSLDQMSADQWYEYGNLPSAQDSAYLKFIAEESGFYRFTMKANSEDAQPVIEAVKNASYTNLTTTASGATETDGQAAYETVVYLLEGKTYYLKGYLNNRAGARTGGDYSAMVSRVPDLRDGVQTDTVERYSTRLYQFTTADAAYYQFTLDGTADTSLNVKTSTLYPVRLTQGQKEGKNRFYYAAKLAANASYLVQVENNGAEDAECQLYAGLKPEIESIELTDLPEKTVYYALFDHKADVKATGLKLTITYTDGNAEDLAYGKRSSWGIVMTVDTSAIQADANGGLIAGEYTATASYLDQTVDYTVQVRQLDLETLETLAEDTPEAFEGAADESIFYAIQAEEAHTYRLYTRDADQALKATLYDEDGKALQTSLGAPDFSLEKALTAGQRYIARIQPVTAGGEYTGTVRLHDATKSTEVTGVNIQFNGQTTEAVYLAGVGDTAQLTALIAPAGAANGNVTWASDDEAVATVNESGLVTMLAQGSANITATTEDGGYTATCRVICDLELPRITQLAPDSGTTIGPDYRSIYAVVEDDAGVDKVELKYRRLGDAAWTEETWSSRDEELQNSVIQITLKLDGLAHGDTLEVEAVPVDKSGRRGEAVSAVYPADLQAPEVRDLAGSYDEETQVVELTWNIGAEPVMDIDRFAIYRSGNEGATWQRVATRTGYANLTEYSYTDSSVGNRDASYLYYVVSYDKYGNQVSSGEITVETTFINQAPVIALSAPSMVVSEKEMTVNLSGTSDDTGIAQITVDYGDGYVDSSTDQLVWKHTYYLNSEEDTEIMTLTVTVEDEYGEASTQTREITVVNSTQAGVLNVTVVDTDGIPVPDAPVYFNLGEDSEEVINTDRSGKVTFIGAGGTADEADEDGFHKVGVLKTGYLPEMKSVKLVNGAQTEIQFVVEEKEIVEGEFEAHRMSLDEIRDAAAAGYIDLDDPDNYHVMQYNVTLEYETTVNVPQITFNYVPDSNYYFGVSVTNINPDYYYVPYVVEEHIVVVIKIPVAASILKSFYNVQLFIINNASEEFSLLDSQVELHVDPDSGMTVMENRNPALVLLGDLPGQSTTEVEWILRGDKSGKYRVSADFSGVLSEFNKLITAHFEGEKELEVRGVDDLELKMQIPDKFTNGEFYYNLQMANIAEEDNENTVIFLPGLNGEGELLQTSMYKQGDTQAAVMNTLPEVLKAGEKIERFYRITDQISAQLHNYPNYEDFVFHFKSAMVQEVTEVGVPLIIEVIPAEQLAALYQQYRAEPATLTLTAPELEYGYAPEEAVITAAAVPADNAEYDLTYTWYDTWYKVVGTGETLQLPTGWLPGDYNYHCVVRATRKDNGNFADSDYDRVIVTTVDRRTVQLDWIIQAASMVYDGTEKAVTAALGNAVGEDEVEVGVEDNVAVNAGTYVAKAVELMGEVADRYVLPTDPEEDVVPEANLGARSASEGELEPRGADEPVKAGVREYVYTIEPKEVGLEWTEAESMVYDRTEKAVTAAATELVEGDECQVTVENGVMIDAGTYTATATALSNANYKLPELATHDYEIEPLEVELVWSGDEALVYDGQAKAVTASVGNAIEGDEVLVTVTGGDETDAGTHTATAAALSNANYKLPEQATHDYEIEPLEAELVWSGDEALVYDGQAKAVTASVGNLIDGDEALVTVSGGDAVNANTEENAAYTATATALSNPNYKLPDEAARNYTIAPKEVSVTFAGWDTRTYDGSASNVTAVVTAGELVGADEAAVTVSGGDAVNAGSYTATATALSNTNYVLSGTLTQSYTITPKEVSVTFAGCDARTYDGSASNVTATVTAGELVGADEAAVTVSGGDAVNAGSYTATATALSNANYVLGGTLTQDYTIDPLTAALSWSGDQDLAYDGQAKAVTAAVSNAVAGDAVSVTVTGGSATDAGTYTATATALTGAQAANYAMPGEGLNHEYTVAQRVAQLLWINADNLFYDKQPKNVTATVSNAVEGDEVNVTVTGGDAVEIGSYTATATGLDNANYAMPAAGLEKNYDIVEDPAVVEARGVLNAIADSVTLDDKAAVEAARAKYDALTDIQKELVGEEAVNRLIAAEAYLAAIEATQGEPDFKLPSALKQIEDEAFTGTGFHYVVLPDGTASIGSKAFADCPNLRVIYIPASTTTIAPDAFDGVEDLVIYGPQGEYCETYAEENHFIFVAE